MSTPPTPAPDASSADPTGIALSGDRRRWLRAALCTGLAAGATGVAGSSRAAIESSARIPFADAGRGVNSAPFGDAVSPVIRNYNRVTPYIATAGLLLEGGLEHARALGFEVVVDLRGGDEDGVAAEARLAARIGIERIHLPVTERAPTDAQVARFAALVHDVAHYPMLVHCVSSNRSGALWALYRAWVGVPAEIAVQEGRAAGLASREQAVRRRLGIG